MVALLGLRRSGAGWRRALGVVVGCGVLAGANMSIPAASAASPEVLEPFSANAGFGFLALEDVVVNNSELEGSIAALGAISSTNPNGYPVLHQAAGRPDYTVPLIDGAPVRILAQRFTGTGSFDVTSRDDSGTTAPGSPEATAAVRLGDIAGLTGSARGGGPRGDFLRVTNPAGGHLDLKQVPADAGVDALATAKAQVADYFPGLREHIAAVDSCLTAISGDGALGNRVTTATENGMVYVSGFATDRPNVIDYDAIAGKTVKLDRAAGWYPTAAAPLIIRVPAGTVEIGQLRFEGWSAHASAQQDYARSILLDLSQVDGAVRIDGTELGAVWGPRADVTYDSGITTNGQWLVRNLVSNGGGELHQHTFEGRLSCGATSSPGDPGAGATLDSVVRVPGASDKTLPSDGGTVVDSVAYTGLTPGATYTLRGVIMGHDGGATAVSTTIDFRPAAADGIVEVSFNLTPAQARTHAGQRLVVFEHLTAAGEPVAEHTDLADEDQTFRVAALQPETQAPSAVTPDGGSSVPSAPATGSPQPGDIGGRNDHKGAAGGVLPATGAAVGIGVPLGAALLVGVGVALVRRSRRHAPATH